MKRISSIAIIIFFISACKSEVKKQNFENSNQNKSDKSLVDTITSLKIQNIIDEFKADNQITKSKSQNKSEIKTKAKNISQIRAIDFPNDAVLNGEPMTQQENISQDIFQRIPDTLTKLAIYRYKAYSNFFPKAIADNFEEGTSREIIMYPKKIVFRFELFENEFASEPYCIKNIIVNRNQNEELYTE